MLIEESLGMKRALAVCTMQDHWMVQMHNLYTWKPGLGSHEMRQYGDIKTNTKSPIKDKIVLLLFRRTNPLSRTRKRLPA
jgi:hypothetical protein